MHVGVGVYNRLLIAIVYLALLGAAEAFTSLRIRLAVSAVAAVCVDGCADGCTAASRL